MNKLISKYPYPLLLIKWEFNTDVKLQVGESAK